MRLKHLKGWANLWAQASLAWVAGVTLYAISQHQIEVQRLNFWADSIEWIINANPGVPVSAKELRSKLGDEKFIAAAPAAYPRADLRETMRHYYQESTTRERNEHPVAAFVLWVLIPPALLYAFGIVVTLISSPLRKRPYLR